MPPSAMPRAQCVERGCAPARRTGAGPRARAARALELDGNFGAPPSPPCFGSQRSASCLPAATSSDVASAAGSRRRSRRGDSARRRAARPSTSASALSSASARRVLYASAIAREQLAEARPPEPRLRREVRAEEVRPAVGQAERRQRPAAALALHHDRVHVDRVDVGALLAIDLDVDEELVHQLRGRARPRSSRAPSRGTSGTPRSRSRRTPACRVRFASANASSPHGHHSTGLSACCRRYGELSAARRFGMPAAYHAALGCAGCVRRSSWPWSSGPRARPCRTAPRSRRSRARAARHGSRSRARTSRCGPTRRPRAAPRCCSRWSGTGRSCCARSARPTPPRGSS